MMKAHRWLWEQEHGPIPDGMEIDHLCRNRACVRASHMELVTHLENVRRGESGQRQARRTHCPQGHPYSGDNLRIRSDGGRLCRACCREYTRQKRMA